MPDHALPVLERIMLNVVETLESISAANGYAYTLTVERPNPSLGNRRRDNLAVVVQGNRVRAEEGEEDANGYTTWYQPVTVVCTVLESESSAVAVDERLNTIDADVERAMVGDDTAAQRGGLALDTWVIDPEYADLPESLVAHSGELRKNFIVHYRHLTGDPYSQ